METLKYLRNKLRPKYRHEQSKLRVNTNSIGMNKQNKGLQEQTADSGCGAVRMAFPLVSTTATSVMSQLDEYKCNTIFIKPFVIIFVVYIKMV